MVVVIRRAQRFASRYAAGRRRATNRSLSRWARPGRVRHAWPQAASRGGRRSSIALVRRTSVSARPVLRGSGHVAEVPHGWLHYGAVGGFVGGDASFGKELPRHPRGMLAEPGCDDVTTAPTQWVLPRLPNQLSHGQPPQPAPAQWGS